MHFMDLPVVFLNVKLVWFILKYESMKIRELKKSVKPNTKELSKLKKMYSRVMYTSNKLVDM